MRSRAALSVTLVWLAACASDPPVVVEPDTISLASLCTELAEADCARLARCGKLASPFEGDGCLLRQGLVRCGPFASALSSAAASGEIVFLELAAKACRDAVGALDCTVGPNVDYLSLAECRAVVAGNVAEGGACSLPGSCTSGLYCSSGGQCPGRCAPRGGNNAPCSFSEPCQEGLFCATPAMRCRARVGLGAPCEVSIGGNACVEGTFCDASQPGQPICVVERGRNNGCTNDYECAAGLSCISNLCSGGQLGDTCASHDDCTGDLACASSRCVQPLGDGDECSSPRIAPCALGLACTSTTGGTRCVPELVLGAPCAPGSAPCWLGRCIDGACAPAAQDGGACALGGECLPDRYCTNGQCMLGVPRCGE
ncbi:hypothetical protein L6R52_19495 [Myxococcota bacterium]|nr:hypothetical protein [Myxococcota bacterium]